MPKLIDLTGKKLGRWKVLYRCANKMMPYGRSFHVWMCECECGVRREVAGPNLRKGISKSCGCLHKEIVVAGNTTHGGSYSVEFGVWLGIMQRTNNPNSERFMDYGGRGIKVSERWHKFENFIADMGKRPRGTTIERKDNDKGYNSSNCIWASRKNQNNNKRNNRLLTFKDETKTISQWAEQFGLKYMTLRARVTNYGWSVEKALTTPCAS